MPDRKFYIKDGLLVNRVSGEAIPDDEPIFILRARDKFSLPTISSYHRHVENAPRYPNKDGHLAAIEAASREFKVWRDAHPDKSKLPGITGDVRPAEG